MTCSAFDVLKEVAIIGSATGSALVVDEEGKGDTSGGLKEPMC